MVIHRPLRLSRGLPADASANYWRGGLEPRHDPVMKTLQEIWPPYGVRIEENDLTLTILTDEDIPGLVDVALSGIHDPDAMPFLTPWTAVEPGATSGEHDSLLLRCPSAVHAREIRLALRSADRARTRRNPGVARHRLRGHPTAETGSWLGQSYQGRGIGTRMRRAVCAFAFDHLGAVELTSGPSSTTPPRSL